MADTECQRRDRVEKGRRERPRDITKAMGCDYRPVGQEIENKNDCERLNVGRTSTTVYKHTRKGNAGCDQGFVDFATDGRRSSLLRVHS